jgi:diacylglycerol kinase family enzyme
MSRRVAAVLALICVLGAAGLLILQVITTFPRGPLSVVLVLVACYAAWHILLHREPVRAIAAGVAGLLVVGAVWLMLADRVQASGLLGLACIGLAVLLGRHVYSVHVLLPPAQPPSRAVVFWNPKSGGGSARKNNLAGEARRRGIEAIELGPDDDLVALVNAAVARGADGLMAAGGDGTQALVATIAAEHNLPFACIPAGTRNHFAMDLGVDRTDVIGSLDAFVTGGEKRVDLADVGGRVFVNNASLGLYAEAVQNKGYRDAKVRTILDTVPKMLGPEGAGSSRELRWTGADGSANQSAAIILVSNNSYRLGAVPGAGTRPRMDAGVLGVSIIGAPGAKGQRQLASDWSTHEFTVDAHGDVPVGVDGEALTLPTPLVFRTHPGALRVRIASHHPGASPSAALPHGLRDAVRRLIRIAGGADPLTLT